MATRKIHTIPAAPVKTRSHLRDADAKRRVAGYARVSTELDEQQGSYESQLRYYENFIKNHSDWEFAGMYSDEGISGTQTKHRAGFQSMIDDALAGKIDLILTKSVSRFARNTVDSLTTIRLLKERNVEVYFEKENIYTFDEKGELLLTIMSSIAQEESRSISENTKWGVKRKFQEGKHSLPYSAFLGYDKGKNGELVINKKQAKTVRLIYKLYLEGKSYSDICRELEKRGCKTATGSTTWYIDSVKRILTNEKYKGDALLQKGYVADFLTHKCVKNHGEFPQYYVENDHEAIIEPEIFDQVQAEIALRKKKKKPDSDKYLWSGMIQCGTCGSWYGPRIWHSKSIHRKTVFECNGKNYRQTNCKSPNIRMEAPEQFFLTAYQKLIQDPEETLKNIKELKRKTLDLSDLERKKTELAEPNPRFHSEKWNELEAEILLKKQAYQELLFLEKAVTAARPMHAFSRTRFRELCDKFIICHDRTVVVFKGGYEIEV